MARYNGYTVPDDFSLEFLADNSQFMDNEHIYQPQQYISDPNPWAQQPAKMNHQMLEQQSTSSTHYDLQQIDPALWQYNDEQDLGSGEMAGPTNEPRDTMIDPQLRIMANHELGESSMMIPRTSSDSHRRTPSREPERPAPPKQAPSQLFVVPFTDQDHHGELFPDSNNMFCDFPGVAFRSFLPKGATTPVSTSRLQPNSYEPIRATRKAQKTSMRKHAAMQESAQPQMSGSFQRRPSGQPHYSSSNSTPCGSGSSF